MPPEDKLDRLVTLAARIAHRHGLLVGEGQNLTATPAELVLPSETPIPGAGTDPNQTPKGSPK